MKIYHWHISRKLDHPSLDPEVTDKLDVSITPAQEDLSRQFIQTSFFSPIELPQDSPFWWKPDDELMLEGWIHERALMDALFERNLFPNVSQIRGPGEDRQIVEDMVFLQLVEDEKAFENIWGKCQEKEDWPELTALATLDGSRWLDYTVQARRLAKEVYRQILGEEQERGYAAKQ